MRILMPACVGLTVVSCIASAVMWGELRSDRQRINDLSGQLAEARTALAARAAEAVGSTAATGEMPQPTVEAISTSAAPVAASANITREEAMAALRADELKRQKALVADAEYRKAVLAQARADMQQRYAGLGVELGLSDKELNALFDLLAGAGENMMTAMAGLTDGVQTDAAARAEAQRMVDKRQQTLKDQIIAMLGPERYAQFEDYDRNQPSRTRVNNLITLLARSGRPLTNAQTRTLTTVMISEQRRMEAESKALRDAGQTDKRSPADIQAETNRRILEQAPSFLDSQQVQVVRGRFAERLTIDRAADRVQQREREVLQESPQ